MPKPITLAFAIWVVAFALRAADLHHILTVDEAYHWFARAAAFQAALAQGDLAGTNIIGHPGVTTMWLGAIGLWLQQGLAGLGILPAPDLAGPVPTWIMLRLPVAATAATGIALSYLLLLRLLDAPTALLAALLLASDPMLVAFGRILHVDALLTIFMLLTVLLALVGFRYDLAPPASLVLPPPRWGYLAAAAVTGGLALLTKSPAVLLLPLVALIGALPLVQAVWQARQAGRPLRRQDRVAYVWHALGQPYLLWLLGLAVVWVLLWPAAWVDLPRAVGRVVNQVRFEGAEPHGWGNFFWGQAVADPGWLFYPVVLLFRLSIWTLPGLGLLLVARRQIPPPQWRTLLIVASVAAVVLLALTLPPKKFDRYALPAFPALVILAATGWIAA
ncbi:MAG: phospholipid carrier-dependent glycosyltransferase, partial [Chloroflexaceae bacterium]|nr:phospholipid carrier-dependent glycosyltransferase [Chloroflexaceae bacterium]